MRLDVKPTTAHLMIPGNCAFRCGYCAQAAGSTARNALSRISWPTFEDEEVLNSLSRRESLFQRVCVQVVHGRDWVARALDAVSALSSLSLPISLAARPMQADLAEKFFDAGVDRLGLSIDAASPGIYEELRSGCLERDLSLVEEAAERFRGRLSTHLIVGLGEREDELVRVMAKLNLSGVKIALFAFTPCPGTKMAKHPAPDYKKYRRAQVALYLIERGMARDFEFDSKGQVTFFGRDWEDLKPILEPSAFMTSGCPGCNRPFYNERPSRRMYNYPRPLSDVEFEEELRLLESAMVK
ncbi:MAG: radical SAM protein [Candidatus Brockarchaeota archaeon]|nr:radical SAM protein [Candidatus Brockarchaeota archaeon]